MTLNDGQPLALISDIHANLHALDAVLAAIEELGIRNVYCLGDVVGYGAFPNECIERLRDRRIPTIAGNHDHAAIGRTNIQFFNHIAKAAVHWTCERLSRENAQWLEERAYTLELGENIFLVHASPRSPEQWGYVLTFGEARACFQVFHQRFCFIGHSHQPAIVEYDGDQIFSPTGVEIPVREECRYLVNVGSVGQPRDRNPLASFVTVNAERSKITFHRTPYDIEAAQSEISKSGLPLELAHRLSLGW